MEFHIVRHVPCSKDDLLSHNSSQARNMACLTRMCYVTWIQYVTSFCAVVRCLCTCIYGVCIYIYVYIDTNTCITRHMHTNMIHRYVWKTYMYMGLDMASTCLAIGKDAHIVAVHDARHHRLHITKHSFLTAARLIHSVIAVGVALHLA